MVAAERQEAKSGSCEFILGKSVPFKDLYSSRDKARHLYGQVSDSLYSVNRHT